MIFLILLIGCFNPVIGLPGLLTIQRELEQGVSQRFQSRNRASRPSDRDFMSLLSRTLKSFNPVIGLPGLLTLRLAPYPRTCRCFNPVIGLPGLLTLIAGILP